MAHPQYKGLDVPILVNDPNYASNYQFEDIFDTTVLEKLDVSEWRNQHFPRPLYSMRYQIETIRRDPSEASRELGLLNALLDLSKDQPIGSPIWFDKLKLTNSVGEFSTSFQYEDIGNTLVEDNGVYLLLYKNFDYWEVAEVQPGGWLGLVVNIIPDLTKQFDVGDYVVPILFGSVKKASQKLLKDNLGSFPVSFTETFNGIGNQSTNESVVNPVTVVNDEIRDMGGDPQFKVLASLFSEIVNMGGDPLFMQSSDGYTLIVNMGSQQGFSITITALVGNDQYGLLSFKEREDGAPTLKVRYLY